MLFFAVFININPVKI